MKIKTDSNGDRGFWCPACKMHHWVNTSWRYNGNPDIPSFSPSVLVTGTGRDGSSLRCHLYVTEGKIQYLMDCSHDLKGKTIAMEDVR